ncbi:MAG: hypothetical protein I3270_00205 [Candidatus Moeniiplasma glomeromycotorum]|nr:hypothetical protein [Candidatus Moeniiplasma glomeromycotorum]MCE8162596.1 hypothetical protein [Candidatus Moeniiplasma glomeromycotorum]MCE8166067.1 hypothetical protein [Candidatus Moeniiplasma glomeromycotorum]MCE8166675.1 hypothetical protein [Candidatus Moeniiplasma glomeromycotorum]
MVKSSEILKNISQWSYDGSTECGGGEWICWGGEDKGKKAKLEDGGWEEIMRVFFKEIKQNPQDWKLGKHSNSDPYFECITVEHKSGRKHYTPEHHGIWGFNLSEVSKEWNEVKNILSKEGKNDESNSPKEPNQETQKPWREKKETWLVIFGGMFFLGLIIYFLMYRRKRKNLKKIKFSNK